MTGFHFSSREKYIFLIFVFVCVVYGLYMGFYRTALAKREYSNLEIIQAKKILLENNKIIHKAEDLESRYKGEVSSLRKNSSPDQEMSSILSEIESTAQGIAIGIKEMKPQRAMNESFYNLFSVSLTVDGRLKEVLQFVHALQDPSRQLMVSELAIEKSLEASKVVGRIMVSRILLPGKGAN